MSNDAYKGLVRYDENAEHSEKYVVKKSKDGKRPVWPYFVIGGADEIAVDALIAYAVIAEARGYDPQYVEDIKRLAKEMGAWQEFHGIKRPDDGGVDV